VDLTPEAKRKIVGENIARLYDIDIPAKLEAIANDEFSQRRAELRKEVPRPVPVTEAATPPVEDTGVAGTPTR